MTRTFLLFCFITIGISFNHAQQINIGHFDSLFSKKLNESREFSIYLPPSYYQNPDQTYPTLYILDGDYNFHYVTGIIELQSGIAENIPEMIVVGISGKGTQTYRHNCKPSIEGIEDSGNADSVISFLEEELIPYIQKKYRVNDYKILSGHSIGGVFTTYAALTKPDLFNHYIAISPALWWANNALNDIAKTKLEQDPELQPNVLMSLADEKGMGVKEFLKIVKNGFEFKQFENENHNSVGAPTYKWALNEIFKHWQVKELYFNSEKELQAYHKKLTEFYPQTFKLANGILYNTVIYILKDKEDELLKIQLFIQDKFPASYDYFNSLLISNYIKSKEYDKAHNIIQSSLKEYPESFLTYQKLAELQLLEKETGKAKISIEKAILLAKKQQIRQWQINELTELKNQIEK